MIPEEKPSQKNPNNSIPRRKIHRLEIPLSLKDSPSLTFLILPSKSLSQNEEKKRTLKIVLLQDELPELLTRRKAHKTRKFVIKGLNSLSFLKTSEENILSNSLDSPQLSSFDDFRPSLRENHKQSEETNNNNNNGNENKNVTCKCKKSHCLKLYCECFLAQKFCNAECICQECSNLENFQEKRNKFIEIVKEKNPTAFTPKIAKETTDRFADSTGKHNKGCNCRKSNCIKKYCECFQAGVKCTDLCKCEDCKNCSIFNKNFHFLRKPLQNLPDDFPENPNLLKHINPSQDFPDENALDKRILMSNYSKTQNTTKHQLNSFNSFHKVLKEDKEDKVLSFIKEKEKNEQEEWNWEFKKSLFKKTL